MAILTPSQLISASNATYFDNVSGSITPTSVRSLNDSWVSSSILVSQTSSLSVLSASYAGTASVVTGTVVSASYALSSSFALTASYALNAGTSIDTGSFVNTSSFNAYTASINGFTGSIQTQVNNLQAATASYITSAQTSSMTVLSASRAISAATASYVANAVSASRATSALNADTASYVVTAQTASYVVSSSYAISSSQAANAALLNSLSSSQFAQLVANNTFTGNNVFGNITASNAQFTSASILNLNVIYETASIIYSSGSNQFGDAANDVQTLYGTVDIKTGPLKVTGSAKITETLNVIGGVEFDFYVGVPYITKVSNIFGSTSDNLSLVPASGYDLFLISQGGGSVRIQDKLIVTGSSTISGSLRVTGSLNVTGGVTGSLQGTASYASQALSSSYASTGSKVSILDDNGNNNHKVTFVNTAVASGGEQILIDPTTTQFTYNPSTNLLVVTASLAQVAQTASYYGGSVVSSSYAVTSSLPLRGIVSMSKGLGNITSITYGDGSGYNISLNALSASYAITAGSASYALTASSVATASYALTASFVNPLLQNVEVSGSLNVTGAVFFNNAPLQVIGEGVPVANYLAPNTILQLVGSTDTIAIDMFSATGSYDSWHVEVVDGQGTKYQDVNASTYAYSTWLSVPSNNGSDPTPEMPRGLFISNGNVAINPPINLGDNNPLPAGDIGDLARSGSHLYFYNGAWTQIV